LDKTGKRFALVTGAASGLGASFARRLARERIGIVLVDRQGDRAREAAAELEARFSVSTHVMAVDLTRPGAAKEVHARCEALGLDIDILVNNAGYHLNQCLHELPWTAIEDNLQLLLKVVLELTHLFLPGMIARHSGRIINVASMSGFMPGGIRLATYNATKTFLIPFTEALNFELMTTGVSATAVCPGFMRTELFVNSGITDVRDSVPGFMWLQPDQVADGAWKAAVEGRPLFVPGTVNRAIAAVAKFTPRRLLRERSRIFHRDARRRLAMKGPTAAGAASGKRVALVTGATSGIGASFSDVLAKEGFDLVLVGRGQEAVAKSTAELAGRHGIKAWGIVQDLSEPCAAEAVWAKCQAFGLSIDVLVNNAGYPLTKPFHRMSWAEVDAAWQVYIRSVVRLSHLAIPGMIARGWGKVINISSLAAFEPGSCRSSLYSSSKAFQATFSESNAAELEGTGVTVTAVCPGFTRTGWAAKSGPGNASAPGPLWMESDEVARRGFKAAGRGVPLIVTATLPMRIVSAMFQIAPRQLVGSFLSKKRAKNFQ